MSLKAFHVVFIAVSLVLCAGFGVWAVREFMESNESASLLIGLGSFAIGLCLIVYGIWFVRKMNGENYT